MAGSWRTRDHAAATARRVVSPAPAVVEVPAFVPATPDQPRNLFPALLYTRARAGVCLFSAYVAGMVWLMVPDAWPRLLGTFAVLVLLVSLWSLKPSGALRTAVASRSQAPHDSKIRATWRTVGAAALWPLYPVIVAGGTLVWDLFDGYPSVYGPRYYVAIVAPWAIIGLATGLWELAFSRRIRLHEIATGRTLYRSDRGFEASRTLYERAPAQP